MMRPRDLRSWLARTHILAALVTAAASAADQAAPPPARDPATAKPADAPQASSKPWPQLTARLISHDLLQAPATEAADPRFRRFRKPTLDLRICLAAPADWRILEVLDAKITDARTDASEDLLAGGARSSAHAGGANLLSNTLIADDDRPTSKTIMIYSHCEVPHKPALCLSSFRAQATLLLTYLPDRLLVSEPCRQNTAGHTAVGASILGFSFNDKGGVDLSASIATLSLFDAVRFFDAQQRPVGASMNGYSMMEGRLSLGFGASAALMKIAVYRRARLATVALEFREVPLIDRGDGSQWKVVPLALQTELAAPDLDSWAAAKYPPRQAQQSASPPPAPPRPRQGPPSDF